MPERARLALYHTQFRYKYDPLGIAETAKGITFLTLQIGSDIIERRRQEDWLLNPACERVFDYL
jgi:hypothetical protein